MTVENKNESEFDKLMGELNTLTKSMPTTDDVANIKGAAGTDDDNDLDDEDKDKKKEGDDKNEPLTKSIRFTDKDGNEIEALDGGELIKSLVGRLETSESTMAKAMSQMAGIVKQQGELIKSLHGKLGELAASGRGRRSDLQVHDRTASEDGKKVEQKVTAKDLLVKSRQFIGKGMTAIDIARLEQRVNSGAEVPADLVAKISALGG